MAPRASEGGLGGDRLALGEGGREEVDEVFTLWERFLALETPEIALEVDEEDRFETLSGQTVYPVERLLNLRPIERGGGCSRGDGGEGASREFRRR